ncbi:MAG TPA: hypothetical protein VN638_08575, partial [Nitrospiraceae bacterium]|nr:hypothetical protein [Nitrospiraceae bacterium]
MNSATTSYTFNYCAPTGTCPADRLYMAWLPEPYHHSPDLYDNKRGTLRLWSIGIPPFNATTLQNDNKISFEYSSTGSGELIKRTLPVNQTGDLNSSRIEYDYGSFSYCSLHFKQWGSDVGKVSGGNGQPVPTNYTRHVTAKRLYLLTDPFDLASTSAGPTATWEYLRNPVTGETNPREVSIKTTIGGYTNETVHFFHASPNPTDPDNGKGANDGLAPEWNDGLAYRVETWEGLRGTGRLLRTEETEYTPDTMLVVPIPPPTPPNPPYTVFYKNNIRTTRTISTLNDDGNKQIITANSDWDGAGHWRVTTESGFGMASPRITRKNYFHLGTRDDLFDYAEISDGNAVFSRSEYKYDTQGRLTRSVDRKTPPGSPNTPVPAVLNGADGDVVTDYEYFGSGSCATPVTGNVCRKVVSSPGTPAGTQATYTVTYGYNLSNAGPYLASKQFLGASWLSINWKRDANSGLIKESCDPAGVCTGYDYDDLGRIKTIDPASTEFSTAISYERCDINGLNCVPSLRNTRVRQSADPTKRCEVNPNANDCIFTEYTYDDLARLIQTKKRDFEGFSVAQRTIYDALSNVLSQSEWVKLNPAGTIALDIHEIPYSLPDPPTLNLVNGFPSTTYSYIDLISNGLDPFGRAWKVIPADGNDSPTNPKYTQTMYRGQDTTVTVKGLMGLSGLPFDSSTSYTKDALGRLVEVSYPNGRYQVSGQSLPLTAAKADYDYDWKDNLIQVDLTAPDGATHQLRSFAYDGLDRLIREDNPENGTTLYERYDALGNLLQKRDSANNVLKMTYDAAGRILETQNVASNHLSRNTYDQPSMTDNPFGLSAGKLTTVESYADDGATLQATEKYYYGGLNGRLSGESTIFPDWSVPGTAGLKTSYTYNNYGLRTRTIYPDEGVSRTRRDVTAYYANGYQLSLLDTANNGAEHAMGIQYNPAGGIWKISLPGSSDIIEPDARNRPSSIVINAWYPSSPPPPPDGGGGGGGGGGSQGGGGTGGTRERQQIGSLEAPGMGPYRSIGVIPPEIYSSGPYSYDAAGNISRIGPSTYNYDAANRLIEAVEYDNEHSIFYTLGWAYDAFGNMIRSSQAVGNGASAFREYCPVGNPGCTLQNNRLAQISLNGLTGNISYDERGNMTADPFRLYNYDLRNRLIGHRYTSYNAEASYAYDAAGHRLVKSANGGTTYYVRDQQGQVLSEFRTSSATGPPAWDRDYLYAAGRLVGEAENDKPDPPTSLTLNSDVDYQIVRLNWSPPADPDLQKYYLYRTENSAHPTTTQLTIYTTTYLDHPANSNYRYDYYVTAVDTAGNESTSSGTVMVKLTDFIPPSNPTSLAATAGNHQVSLSWVGSTD